MVLICFCLSISNPRQSCLRHRGDYVYFFRFLLVTTKMSHIVVIRPYKPGDEFNCHEMIKDGVTSSINSAFFGNLFKEITFQVMILMAAIMFIFFGMPFTVCLLVIPLVIIMTYVGTYLAYTAKAMEVDQEVSNIARTYMSNAFSCFWVAEAFEPYMMSRSPCDFNYQVITENQFRESNIDVTSQSKRIVGSIGLLKSHSLDKGAWIKRLCVHRSYRRKGIASCLLKVAVDFAIEQGYSCANVVASEHTEGGRELCLKKGFELKQMYHKPIVGSLITVLMYELTYQIKPGDDNYVSYPKRLFSFR
ncbi:N-acetyltransferase family 8 member 3 isoform X1 [Nasonia vitripennis]|uniref:N-acetyltransferase domain-containing protein n=2 Tax=Nasonia vitripennis TaxID=7425 RepID=A0A7M7HC26_NASVI|nr:N-acetyltransferase family 8 member 3 isoform X1 [Nasonia vitripennis]